MITRELHRSLREITETLARNLAQRPPQTPAWSPYQWRMACAVASMHGVSGLLYTSLRWDGPTLWRRFLEQQRAHVLARHDRIEALWRLLDESARASNLCIVALKGAALHHMGIYQAGERPMADLDLLVRSEDVERTSTLLAALGFRQTAVTWKERVFTTSDPCVLAAFGEHSGNSLKIEVHERIGEKLPFRITDMSARMFDGAARPGLNGYPSLAALMLHLLLHAAGSMTVQALRMVQLHDMALLSDRMSPADWQMVLRGVSDEPPWWAYPPLRLMARYYPSKAPAEVLAALSAKSSVLLRVLAARYTLSSVSFTFPWVKAFPGIEWARSPGEWLSYAANRIRPTAAQLAERELHVAHQAWGAPSAWQRMPQGRRVLRWVASRPTRPQTLHAVSVALDHVHDAEGSALASRLV